MKRFFASLLALCTFVITANADNKPIIRDVKAPPHLQQKEECCGNGNVPVGADVGKFLLGRATPKKSYDYGDYRFVVGQDGKTRVFARLTHVMDSAKRKKALPDSADWSVKAPDVLKQMYLNDKYGCCVISSRVHAIGFMAASDGAKQPIASNTEVFNTYQAACGRGDNGCDMSAVNVYMQKTGIVVAGITHKIDSAVAVDWTNQDLVKAAIYIFGNLEIGMQLPNDWYQSADGADWDVTDSAIVGGHEVQGYGYDAKGVLISTWGGKRRILWAAFTSRRWLDEVYVMLSPDWYGSDKLAPNGIDADTLKADLAAIAAGTIPQPTPVPVPPNPVPPNPVPVPPIPSGPFTGTLVFENGILVAINPGATDLKKDLAKAGFNPQTIVDIMQFISDLSAKKGFEVYIADVMKIVADLTLAEKKKNELPAGP